MSKGVQPSRAHIRILVAFRRNTLKSGGVTDHRDASLRNWSRCCSAIVDPLIVDSISNRMLQLQGCECDSSPVHSTSSSSKHTKMPSPISSRIICTVTAAPPARWGSRWSPDDGTWDPSLWRSWSAPNSDLRGRLRTYPPARTKAMDAARPGRAERCENSDRLARGTRGTYGSRVDPATESWRKLATRCGYTSTRRLPPDSGWFLRAKNDEKVKYCRFKYENSINFGKWLSTREDYEGGISRN